MIFEDFRSLAWISYAFTPIILLIKFSFVSVVLYIGIVICDVQDKVKLGSVFKIVIASEIVFVFAGLLKFLWFYLFAGNYDLNDLGFFYPISLINFFKISEVSKFWVFPLQTVNLFQIFYLFSISFGLNKIGKIEKTYSDRIVLLSYLPALVLLITLVMFLSIDAAL
jgi:hypothetical protein